MKLHLGCGRKNLGKEWIHIDISPHDHIDHQIDIRKLDPIPTESVDEIYACHVLEHFPRKEIVPILSEWNRTLKINGRLRIAVPDFENICKLYVSGLPIEKFYGLISGGQKDEYDFHYHIFDEKNIKNILEQSGFKTIERYNWKDFLPADYDDYSRAYVPHMDFENGTCVSLNIIAYK
jgi:predicted SAM-dependent methyltransferase